MEYRVYNKIKCIEEDVLEWGGDYDTISELIKSQNLVPIINSNEMYLEQLKVADCGSTIGMLKYCRDNHVYMYMYTGRLVEKWYISISEPPFNLEYNKDSTRVAIIMTKEEFDKTFDPIPEQSKPEPKCSKKKKISKEKFTNTSSAMNKAVQNLMDSINKMTKEDIYKPGLDDDNADDDFYNDDTKILATVYWKDGSPSTKYICNDIGYYEGVLEIIVKIDEEGSVIIPIENIRYVKTEPILNYDKEN